MKIVLIILTLFFSINVFSQSSDITKNFQTSLNDFFNEVNDPNFLSLLDIDFKDVKKKSKDIKVFTQNLGFRAASGDANRFGAASIGNTVYFNGIIYDRINNSDAKEELFCHESLRAQGYNDEHYQITLLLELIKKRKKLDLSLDVFQEIARGYKINKSYDKSQYLYESGDGTGTSVGSGGDDISLSVKVKCLTSLINENYSAEKIVKFLNMPFESEYAVVNNILKQNVTIEMINGEKTIYLPGVLYVYGGTQMQKQIVDGAISLVKSLL